MLISLSKFDSVFMFSCANVGNLISFLFRMDDVIILDSDTDSEAPSDKKTAVNVSNGDSSSRMAAFFGRTDSSTRRSKNNEKASTSQSSSTSADGDKWSFMKVVADFTSIML